MASASAASATKRKPDLKVSVPKNKASDTFYKYPLSTGSLNSDFIRQSVKIYAELLKTGKITFIDHTLPMEVIISNVLAVMKSSGRYDNDNDVDLMIATIDYIYISMVKNEVPYNEDTAWVVFVIDKFDKGHIKTLNAEIGINYNNAKYISMLETYTRNIYKNYSIDQCVIEYNKYSNILGENNMQVLIGLVESGRDEKGKIKYIEVFNPIHSSLL